MTCHLDIVKRRVGRKVRWDLLALSSFVIKKNKTEKHQLNHVLHARRTGAVLKQDKH